LDFGDRNDGQAYEGSMEGDAQLAREEKEGERSVATARPLDERSTRY
jgi:hypothetical protein